MAIKAHNGSCNPADLRPFERNSRVHTDAQVDAVARSIEEFGFTRPVIIDSDGVILAGHCAVRAALKLGLKKVPYRRLVGLSDEQKRAYVIADNRIGDMSSWDKELLALELDELQALDYDLAPIGFDEIPGLDNGDGNSKTIGDDRYLLQLEFPTEKEMETVFAEMQERGIETVILQ